METGSGIIKIGNRDLKEEAHMFNIIIWGTGKEYNRRFNLIKHFEMTGEISILGIMSDDEEIKNTLDGYKFYKKDQIGNVEFDYCLVTIQNMEDILVEATELGISRQKLIPSRVLEIPYFNFKKYIRLKQEGLSILSRNCWAGICYHYLALEFQSPTINMLFAPSDFNKLISNLDYYLSLPIKFVGMRYDENLQRDYPVGKLDDINLFFNHYTDFEDAVLAWNRRKKRITKNIVVISSTTEKEDVIEFLGDGVPYKNKLIFVPKELDIKSESVFPIYYNDDMTIGMHSNNIANGCSSRIDLLSFLCQMKYDRID